MSGLWQETNAEMVLVAEIVLLEIIKRAKSGGEIVSWKEDVRAEALRRGAKAGHCTRNGEPVSSGRIISMPSNEQYRKNYRRIFGHD